MTEKRLMQQAAVAMGLWLLCLVLIATQLDAALDRCARLWTMLRWPQGQALVVGASPGLRVQTRTWNSLDRQRVVAVAVDSAGCIRYAGATESAQADATVPTIYLRPVLQFDPPRDCMSEHLP